MKKLFVIVALAFVFMGAAQQEGCDGSGQSSDTVQMNQQEQLLKEATSEVGMPAISNFQERKLLKMLFELRDKDGLVTYTYLENTLNGKVGQKLCDSIGFGIPYSTQYTNPSKVVYAGAGPSYEVIAQADPNGLFSPGSADGTWVMCSDPSQKGRVRPMFVEPKVIVSTFPLD